MNSLSWALGQIPDLLTMLIESADPSRSATRTRDRAISELSAAAVQVAERSGDDPVWVRSLGIDWQRAARQYGVETPQPYAIEVCGFMRDRVHTVAELAPVARRVTAVHGALRRALGFVPLDGWTRLPGPCPDCKAVGTRRESGRDGAVACVGCTIKGAVR